MLNDNFKIIMKELAECFEESYYEDRKKMIEMICRADRIFVIDEGKILEEGNHESLMQLEGAYYQLYRSQFK